MARYMLRHILHVPPIVFGVLLLTFGLFRILPGDFAQKQAGGYAAQSTVEDFRRVYGLDKPLFLNFSAIKSGEYPNVFDSQFVNHCRSMLSFDFGTSWQSREKIGHILLRRIVPSICLTAPIFLGTLVISISLGLLSVYKYNSKFDRTMVILCVIGMNLPVLAVIAIAQYIFSYRLNWFPLYGFDSARHLILPIIIGILAGIGGQVRFFRTLFSSEIKADYVRTAYAKGASSKRVLLVHVLRNALPAILTRFMLAIPFLFLGSFLLERFFGIPGAGHLMIEAIQNRDYPVVSAMTFITSILFIVGNLMTDFCYSLVDPRITLE